MRYHSTDTSNVRLVERVIVDATVGDRGRAVQPNRPVSMILCSVKQGSVDIYFGGVASRVPDLHFGQTNAPVWVPVPCGQYEFFIVPAGNPGQAVLASLWLGGPD